MKEADIIQRSSGPTEWCAPMVPVQKSNKKLRIRSMQSYWYDKLPWKVQTEPCYRMQPMTDLLKSDWAWTWGPSQARGIRQGQTDDFKLPGGCIL